MLIDTRHSIDGRWYWTGQAWCYLVTFPSSAPASDRSAVLGWLKNYAAQIRRERPLWWVEIHIDPDVYRIEATPFGTLSEYLSFGLQRMIYTHAT